MDHGVDCFEARYSLESYHHPQQLLRRKRKCSKQNSYVEMKHNYVQDITGFFRN